MKILQVSRWSTSLFQLSLPFAIYFCIQANAEWYWWATFVFFNIVIYSMIGNNIALHRYFTHNHFEISKPIEWLFAWCGSMIVIGEPVSYAMTHSVHHDPRYTDTELDVHGRVRGLKSILVWWHREVNIKETPIRSKRVIDLGRRYGLLHRYYLLFVAINAVLLYLISWKIFLFCWWLPACLTAWGVAGAVITQHWDRKPNNGWNHKWMIYYEALHKNHHDYPRAPNTALTKDEIDYSYQLSRVFLPNYYWEGQPNEIHQTQQS